MSTDSLRQEVARLRRELDEAQSEITGAGAVLARLERHADRVRRGSRARDGADAITALRRYLRGADRPGSLSYLTDPYVSTDSGTTTAVDAARDPTTSAVDGFVRDLETYVGGGSVDASALVSDFEALVTDGTADDLGALVSFFQHAVAAARGYRDERESTLNNGDWQDGSAGSPGKLQAFLDSLEDELALLSAEPVAMLPVRLETRFVYPNDESSPRSLTSGGTADPLQDLNRDPPGEAELRVRVYPDQIHVDSHEPELTIQEEQWGRNFWAQVWLACHPISERQVTENGTTRTVHEIDYDPAKVPDDLEPVLADLLTDWQSKFSTDGADFYSEIKERAWGQLVDRFGRERAAHVVHTLAPTRRAQAMLTGYEGAYGGPFADGVPELTFPAVDLRPDSWSRQPRAGLLPDRWIAVGHWRHKNDPEGNTTRLRVTGDAIRQPLPVGPDPERLGSAEGAKAAGDAPPGMEWMADWTAARRAGMGLTIRSADLGGTDPGEVVFEEFLVVGVRASESGATVTDRLESLLDAHHYTDGLELLDRGTPTNNSEQSDAGYTSTDDPAESVADECGPLRTEFGDFTDGDLLARALGIAAPGSGMEHVFAHVEGADGRSQADARHMNSLLWSGTIGYYLRNLLIDNRWTDRQSIWSDTDRTPDSFPNNPKTELGETLKQIDAWRRHFVRYVRAGGPFPPIRVGQEPYGVLPAERLSKADDSGSASGAGGAGRRIGNRLDDDTVTDQIKTPTGGYRIDTGKIGAGDSDESGPTDGASGTADGTTTESTGSDDASTSNGAGTGSGDGTDTGSDDATAGTAGSATGQVGQVSSSGYSVAVTEPTTQVEQDLYGSSFDPAAPATKTETSGSLPTTGLSSDGGATTQTRQRAFRTDGEFPGALRSQLGSFTDAWENASDTVTRVGTGGSGASVVDEILGREATADDYIRELLRGFDELEGRTDEYYDGLRTNDPRNWDGWTKTTEHMRQTLTDIGMEHLDPRLAWMLSEAALNDGVSDRPVALVTDGREPEYLTDLYTESLDFLQTMGLPVGLDSITIDKAALKSEMGWGDEIDPLSDQELFVHLVVTEPEHGKLGDLRAAGVVDLDDTISQARSETYGLKLNNLRDTDGDSLQNTLFKQVTRFSTVQAYVGGRLRLGLKWDTVDAGRDSLFGEGSAFLQPFGPPQPDAARDVDERVNRRAEEVAGTPDDVLARNTGVEDATAPRTGNSVDSPLFTQQPIPDPSVHTERTKRIWDWLDEEVPKQYWLGADDSSSGGFGVDIDTQYTTYANVLRHTSAPLRRFDTPTVDPRMREVFDAIEYLSDRDPDTLGRLFTETLDLASHRLDAWWTSLATRRLFEHRETQEADFYDGAEYEFVGDQFRRGEDTEKRPELGGSGTSDGSGEGNDSTDLGTATAVAGRTRFGTVGNQHFDTTVSGEGLLAGSNTAGAADDGPVSYVGAYGYVENLHSDTLEDELDTAPSASGGENAEYIHAPSPQHATTAAVLRSGRRNHADENDQFEDGDLANLLDVDLSPGRVRAARQVLDGVRQGQMLGDLLGYRFERRLLEKTQSRTETNAGEIALPKYKFALRRAFPGTEDKLDHGDGEDDDDKLDVGTEAAASDVLDGYAMFKAWQEKSETEFFESVGYDGPAGDDLTAAMSGAERSAMVGLLEELAAIVDSVTDLLIAENVHQLGKGNFARAGGGIDDLVKGKAVADPEVAQTPRESVGVTHRLGVTFGDPDAATTEGAWTYDTPVIEPGTLPSAGGSSFSTIDSGTPLALQARPDAEPNLNAWLGELLPDPARVSCRASLTWDEGRDFATGTFATPTSAGIVTVEDLDFQPDLVVLELAHGVSRSDGAGGDYGFTHGVALRSPDGLPTEHSTSVGTHFDGSDAGATVDTDHALDAHLHDPAGQHGQLRGSVRFTEDGFDVSFDTVRTRGPAEEGLVVTYHAYALADVSGAEVGTFQADGATSIPLDVDADHVMLFGNTLATDSEGRHTNSGAAGFSRGIAVDDGSGGISQHALGSSVDPETGTHVAGVRDDRAVHLPFSDDGSVAGATSLQVNGLGTSLDIGYESQHAGAAGTATRAITYVALGSNEDVPTAETGVVDSGGRSAGDTTTIRTGFEPGVVELVALPDVTTADDVGPVTTGGLATGAATGVGEQQVVHHSVRSDGQGGVVATGGETGGDSVVLPALAADGSTSGEDVVRVTSLSESGFTLTFSAVADGNQAVAWRAWPAEPESVTHVAETGITLDDLALSPLDATYLTQQNSEAGASQLERRMRYHLVRNPPSHEPPVPDDATADLEFGTTAPGAGGSDPLSIGAFLEVIAGLRELVQGSRPMDATDLGHPDETASTGYTEDTVTELSARADRAQDRLASAGSVIENRLALLDPDAESAVAITDGVATLHDQLRAFTSEVPFDGLAAAASDVQSGPSGGGDAFLTDLERLRDHLPAGSTNRENRSYDFEVAPAPGQELGADAGTANTTLEVELWSTSTAEWFSKSRTVTTDDEGAVSLTMDFSDVRPGTGFVAVLSDGTNIEAVTEGIVLVPEDARTVEARPGRMIDGQAEDSSKTKLDVSITESATGATLTTTTVETNAVGEFSLSADFSGYEPWTRFTVEASENGTTVDTHAVYVAPEPERAVENSAVLSSLLWIEDRAEAFSPHGDGPTAALDAAVTDETDWTAVGTELETIRNLNEKTGGGESGTPPQSDIDAVASLVDDGSGPALESLDLEAVDAAVAGVTNVVDEFGLASMFDVTGRPDRTGGTQFWPVRSAIEDEAQVARLATLLDQPDAAFDSSGIEAGFAPELQTVLSGETEGVYPDGDDVDQLVRYLHALARVLPSAIDDPALSSTLSDPEGFVRGFMAVLYHPDAVPTGQARSTFLSDFRRFVRRPVLGGIAGIDDQLEDVADPPYYNRDDELLDTAGGERGTDATGQPEDIEKRKRELRTELGDDARIWQTGIETRGRGATPSGTPVTDCRFLLEGFRQQFLPALFDELGAGGALPDPSTARNDFTSTFGTRLSTLSTVVSEQAANLDAGRTVGAFDESLRRGVLETLRRAMLRVSYFGVYGSTPRSVAGGQPADEETLVAQARTVHDEVTRRYREAADLSASASGLGLDERVSRQVSRLEALFGDSFQVLPTFRPVNGAELTATFGRSEALQDGDPMAAETWLQRAARVRDESAAFRRALSYAETVTKVRHRDLTVGQVPHRQHERWVGLDGQAAEPGRLSLVMQEAAGFEGEYDTDRVTGLFVDEFVESVPGETETTGVAINYDDPDATAPHAILLALPDGDEGWSSDHLSRVVRDTMDLARYRLVDLEDLDDFETLLPMLDFPTNDALRPDAPSIDVDRIERYHRIAPEWWKVQARAAEYQLDYQPPVVTSTLEPTSGGEK